MSDLLTFQNAKTIKGESLGWLTAILYLAPADLAGNGVNLCPAATPGCKASCLYTAGRGAFNSIQKARLNKTERLLSDPVAFEKQLFFEINRAHLKAQRLGLKLAVRLNGTSDIPWERLTYLIQSMPNIQFYDYTKIKNRLFSKLPANYHLTFSASENTSIDEIKLITSMNFNVAIPFKSMPKVYQGIPVLDGDQHDLRFLDARGLIVGLTPKGKAKRDNTGFVRECA